MYTCLLYTSDAEETIFSEPVDTEMFDALGVGPGLGQNETTAVSYTHLTYLLPGFYFNKMPV